MTWRRISTLIVAIALVAMGCGSTSTTVTGDAGSGSAASSAGQPCDPGPSAGLLQSVCKRSVI